MSRADRHRGPRHARRKPAYQGWAPVTDQTPPMGFPAVDQMAQNQAAGFWSPPPAPASRPDLGPAMRWLVAGAMVMAGGLVAVFAVLTLAFILGEPPPATANVSRETSVEQVTETQPRVEQVTEIPDQRVRVSVTADRVKVVARQMCPSEDSCTVDFVGDGTYVIERGSP